MKEIAKLSNIVKNGKIEGLREFLASSSYQKLDADTKDTICKMALGVGLDAIANARDEITAQRVNDKMKVIYTELLQLQKTKLEQDKVGDWMDSEVERKVEVLHVLFSHDADKAERGENGLKEWKSTSPQMKSLRDAASLGAEAPAPVQAEAAQLRNARKIIEKLFKKYDGKPVKLIMKDIESNGMGLGLRKQLRREGVDPKWVSEVISENAKSVGLKGGWWTPENLESNFKRAEKTKSPKEPTYESTLDELKVALKGIQYDQMKRLYKQALALGHEDDYSKFKLQSDVLKLGSQNNLSENLVRKEIFGQSKEEIYAVMIITRLFDDFKHGDITLGDLKQDIATTGALLKTGQDEDYVKWLSELVSYKAGQAGLRGEEWTPNKIEERFQHENKKAGAVPKQVPAAKASTKSFWDEVDEARSKQVPAAKASTKSFWDEVDEARSKQVPAAKASTKSFWDEVDEARSKQVPAAKASTHQQRVQRQREQEHDHDDAGKRSR